MTSKKAVIAACVLAMAVGATIGSSNAGAQVRVQPAPVAPGVPVVAAPAAAPSPVDDLQALVDHGKYTDALKLANRLLAARGAAGAGVDRFRVAMLRGDAMAGNKAVQAAIVAYKSASKETVDARQAALARWTVELFTRSKGVFFSQKMAGAAVPAKALNLNDPAERKQAFGQLLNENLTLLDPKIKAATGSVQLADIVPVVKQVQELETLDLIANDNDALTTHVAGDLLDHSRNLLSSTLKGMWTRIGDIDTAANTPNTVSRPITVNGQLVNQQTTSKPGLTAGDRGELSDMLSTAGQIADVTVQFVALSHSDKDWLQIKNDADRVAGRARDLLAQDFSQSTSTSDVGNGYGQSQGGTTIINGGVSGFNGGYSFGNGSGLYPGNNPNTNPNRGHSGGGGTTPPTHPGTGTTTPTPPNTPTPPASSPKTPITPGTPTPTPPSHTPVAPGARPGFGRNP